MAPVTPTDVAATKARIEGDVARAKATAADRLAAPRSWADRPLLAIDTETTGTDPFQDRIVEVATMLMDPSGAVTDSWSTIVDPGVPIPDDAAGVHGITSHRAYTEGVPTATALTDLAGRLWEHLETWQAQAPVVMFNARFDWPLLLQEADRHHVEFPTCAPILDPYLLDRICDTWRPGRRNLTLVLGHYDIQIEPEEATGAHGAVADTIAAGHIMRQMLERFPDLREQTLAGLWLRQVHGHERDRQRYVDHVRCTRDPRFDTPAGWPVPVQREQDIAEAAPSARSRPPAYNAGDVAKRARTVFQADYDAAPRGCKSKVLDRLRHAAVWTATGGRTHSARDCDPGELGRVMRLLNDIAAGRVTYTHEALDDSAGVTFTLLRPGHADGDKEVTVTWDEFETGEATAAAVPGEVAQ